MPGKDTVTRSGRKVVGVFSDRCVEGIVPCHLALGRLSLVLALLAFGACHRTPLGALRELFDAGPASVQVAPDARVPDAPVDRPPDLSPDLPLDQGLDQGRDLPPDRAPDVTVMAPPMDMAPPQPPTAPPSPPAPPVGCQPRDETCNGADDDCDGKIDEDQAAVPCPNGGSRYCVAGKMSECPRACAECRPGSARVCFISYCTYWGTQTCAADGRSFGLCREASVPPECAAVSKAHKKSAELERCCIANGYCCLDEFDLDGDGDRTELLGRCGAVTCTP